MKRAVAAAIVCAAIGCDNDAVVTPKGDAPEIIATVVASNPNNVLSAIVTAHVRAADSVAVRFELAGRPLNGQTPAIIPVDSSARIAVLGLLPETAYSLQVVAFRDDQVAHGGVHTFSTGSLPPDLPSFAAGGVDPSPGYVSFATGLYGVVIDNSGRIVWYHKFAPPGPGLNFQAQPNGRFTARPPDTDPSRIGSWLEIDPLGNQTRTLKCVGDLQPRFHDLLVQRDGSYWMLCDDTRTVDLSQQHGVADARVTATAVQHVGSSGELLFQWTPFDHFNLLDLPVQERLARNVNWTHGNALDLDTDGNVIVSFRNLSELTKIDTRTGAVLWRLGGARNQFTFVNASSQPFARQHGLRVVAPGELLLLDNLGDPAESRAERYAYDASARTARLISSYGSQPPVVALLGGTTQQLNGGSMLVAYGNGDRVEEYNSIGQVLWRIEGSAGYVFRAQRIYSLYNPGLGINR